jgi:glycerol-3-phosphate acyltransferase PlsY
VACAVDVFKGGTGISATIGGLFFFEPQMTVIILILCLISLKLLLYTKKGGILGFSPLETVESVGFILVILYLLKFGSSFSKSYMLLVTGVVVLRRIERVFNLFSEKRA